MQQHIHKTAPTK